MLTALTSAVVQGSEAVVYNASVAGRLVVCKKWELSNEEESNAYSPIVLAL